MPKSTIANIIVETLANIGVRRVYGVPGDSLNAITDSIRTHPSIDWVHTRNEEAAAFAAGADAHLTGTLAVCAGSCGPGNTHLINGLYDCQRSRVPVLAIAAQIPTREIGSDYFQETKPDHIFKDCSFYCETISHPSQMPRVLEIAIRTAIAKQGVAVIILSGDTALEEAVLARIPLALEAVKPLQPIVTPEPAVLSLAAQMISAASRITILGGAGCAEAHSELLALAEATKAPIVHALRGKEYIDYDNPYDVGMTGLIGFTSGHYAMQHCDLLLMVGTDFPYTPFFPSDAKVIQIDLRGEHIGRRTSVDLGLVGTVRDTLRALIPLLAIKTDATHLEHAQSHFKQARKGLDELATGEPGKQIIHPQHLTAILDKLASPDAVFTCDVGTPTVWAARYLRMNGQRRLIGSFNHGSMANALPQAIGAQMAFPNRQVISMSGDGGLAMLMGEMLSLKQLNAPVKIIVFQNNALSFVELEMKAVGIISFGTDLVNPDFAKLADACGIFARNVDSPDELESAVAAALAHPGPALVAVQVAKQELSMPPTISLEQAKGFGLYMVKAILNHRGDELVDLAETNLRAFI
ncbi:ubiquinone-dependent pyruvate dehydrogenase [Granulicella sibirica]|uniref:Pyruvate dehydrogenase [ubiquinone] n=1 Tax=Granulicella sibirica TaxID=2479048 RepID=A0A4Q0T0B0_9BACT|nr:ubiquinone-dependent pyruvate dehydrogenase [Granulicella sibirica]RXH55378.1 Pyruvate oxidase [ubiquinone, cytochrome] [Granulicella sibirica]